MKSQRTYLGFTLLELLAIVLVVGIIAVVATPIYTEYARKGRFQEPMQVAESLKIPVAACIQDKNTLTGCSGGVEDIPANAAGTNASDPVDADYNFTNGYAVTDGVITVTAITGSGLTGQTIILTPVKKGNHITWTKTGTCASSTNKLC